MSYAVDQAFAKWAEELIDRIGVAMCIPSEMLRTERKVSTLVIPFPGIRGRSRSHSRKIWRERRSRMSHTVLRWWAP